MLSSYFKVSEETEGTLGQAQGPAPTPYFPMTRRINPKHRQSIRLRAADYRKPKLYFVTICTKDRECLMGEVVNGEMQLNEIGRMVADVIKSIPIFYSRINIDEFEIMPNHIHMIIKLGVGATPRGCPDNPDNGIGQAQRPAPTFTLFDIIHRFKSLTTACYRRKVHSGEWPAFKGKLWQRNYYERILRITEVDPIRQYIRNNPINWQSDPEHPNNKNH